MNEAKSTSITIASATKMAQDLQDRIFHENDWKGTRKDYHFENECEAYELTRFILQYFKESI